MISYDNTSIWLIVFKRAGSVLPRVLPLGVFCCILGLALGTKRELGKNDDLVLGEDTVEDHVVVGIMGVVMGYLLVQRTELALARWMDAMSEVQIMISKWGDAYNLLTAFFAGKTGSCETQLRIQHFRVRIAHWFSLMSCLAFATLRTGHEANLADVKMTPRFGCKIRNQTFGGLGDQPAEFAPSASCRSAASMMTNPERKVKEWALDLEVLHAPTVEEAILLENSSDKVRTLCLWIVQAIMVEVRAGTLDIPPPITTRVFQEISTAMLGFHQALKVAHVPFPFPFAQMVSFFLVVLLTMLPFYIDSFTKNVFFTAVSCFFLPLAFCGLNVISVELEAPFGEDPNDVDIKERHETFVSTLEEVLRQHAEPPISYGYALEQDIIEGHLQYLEVKREQLREHTASGRGCRDSILSDSSAPMVRILSDASMHSARELLGGLLEDSPT